MQWYHSKAGESALSQWSLLVHWWGEGRGESDWTVRCRADGVGLCIWTLPWRQWGTHEELWSSLVFHLGGWGGAEQRAVYAVWPWASTVAKECRPEWVLRVDQMCLMCGKSCLQESLGRNTGGEKKNCCGLKNAQRETCELSFIWGKM